MMVDKGTVKLWHCLVVGFLMRVALMFYGLWQDETMQVKYTDIDYHVFTDAARFITEGKSPYERATYRYTPLLAVLLTANIYITPAFGKCLFIICDVLAGYLIYRILHYQSYNDRLCVLCAALWLLNPLSATVSSRGNAESILAVLVLNTLYLLQRDRPKLAACVYAASVHMKIYPVTYALPIYLFLGGIGSSKENTNSEERLTKSQDVSLSDKFMDFVKLLVPNKARLEFIFVSVLVFVALTGICYLRYGHEFLQETYLYHVTRKDVRHNFSIYFYMLYLTTDSDFSSLIGLVAFIPQVVLLVTYSFHHYRDLPYCFFLHTFVFVTFNKVCTSQYFLWYLCILPLIVPSLRRITLPQTAVMVGSWFLAQALWLAVAYKLEFEGQSVLFELWLCCIAFFIVNVSVLYKITSSYQKLTAKKHHSE